MHLGQGVLARAQEELLAVGEPQFLQGAFLVEGRTAETLEDPAGVLGAALRDLGAGVAEDRRQQVGEDDVAGEGEFEGGPGGAEPQPDQPCRHRAAAHLSRPPVESACPLSRHRYGRRWPGGSPGGSPEGSPD